MKTINKIGGWQMPGAIVIVCGESFCDECSDCCYCVGGIPWTFSDGEAGFICERCLGLDDE